MPTGRIQRRVLPSSHLSSPRLAEIVEYKFFGGMTEAEIGELLELSPRTVRNDWRKAKAWLSLELERS